MDLLLLDLCQLLPPLSCCHCKYFYLRNVTKLKILQQNFTPQIFVALPHPFFFFLEQLGLENWTENSWRAMILFPLHYHHQSNWMISCLYLLFWKQKMSSLFKLFGINFNHFLSNKSAAHCWGKFHLFASTRPASFLTEWQLSEINYRETVFITLPLGGWGALQRAALWHT